MAKQTIKLKNYSDVNLEKEAVAALYPGHMIELTSANKVQPQATAGGKTSFMVATEDAMQGKGIDDKYAIGDKVQVWIPGRGDIANLLLEDEENIAIGDFMEVATGGRVRKWTNGTQIGVATEAKDLSSNPEGSESSAGGAYFNPRIAVRIL